jgi:hypothetical protein
MKIVNSLSGGKTSSYIAVHYPADYNIFALVRTDDKNCIYPDAKVRQIVSDKIGKEFIGTLEDDNIINIILDLEQFIGKQITWVSGETYEQIIIDRKNYLPNPLVRYCTTELKMYPIFNWFKPFNCSFCLSVWISIMFVCLVREWWFVLSTPFFLRIIERRLL